MEYRDIRVWEAGPEGTVLAYTLLGEDSRRRMKAKEQAALKAARRAREARVEAAKVAMRAEIASTPGGYDAWGGDTLWASRCWAARRGVR